MTALDMRRHIKDFFSPSISNIYRGILFFYSFLDVVLHYFPSLAGPMYCKLLVPSIRIIF